MEVRSVELLASPPSIEAPWRRRAVQSSGLSEFDAALEERVTKPLRLFFQVAPDFAYYNESARGESPNALASPSSPLQSTDGLVLFGLDLLAKMLKEKDGDYAALGVCAHEYGHIYQYRSGLVERIGAILPCYCIELHADYLAGFFIGRTMQEKLGSIDIQQIGRVWAAWEKKSCSHGTNVQRSESIHAGFRLGLREKHGVHAAAERGLDYLNRYRQ